MIISHRKPQVCVLGSAEPGSRAYELAVRTSQLDSQNPEVPALAAHGADCVLLPATLPDMPADNRDLNYNVYFQEGQEILSHEEDYHSHNTERLTVDGVVELLMQLPSFRNLVG